MISRILILLAVAALGSGSASAAAAQAAAPVCAYDSATPATGYHCDGTFDLNQSSPLLVFFANVGAPDTTVAFTVCLNTAAGANIMIFNSDRSGKMVDGDGRSATIGIENCVTRTAKFGVDKGVTISSLNPTQATGTYSLVILPTP